MDKKKDWGKITNINKYRALKKQKALSNKQPKVLEQFKDLKLIKNNDLKYTVKNKHFSKDYFSLNEAEQSYDQIYYSYKKSDDLLKLKIQAIDNYEKSKKSERKVLFQENRNQMIQEADGSYSVNYGDRLVKGLKTLKEAEFYYKRALYESEFDSDYNYTGFGNKY